MSTLEYGVSKRGDNWVMKERNLTQALQAARDADNPDEWRIMERAVSEWTEVE